MKSMTAFTQQTFQQDWGSLTWTLRSVNHRYLDAQYQLPPSAEFSEPLLRDILKQRLARGRITLTLTLSPNAQQDTLKLDHKLLAQLRHSLEHIQHTLPNVAPVDPVALLRWPGLVSDMTLQALTPEQMKRQLQDTLKQALSQHIQARSREGAALKNALMQRVDKAQQQVRKTQQKLPDLRQKTQKTLKQKLNQPDLSISQERLAQEAAILIQKMDIDEEVDRLNTHLQEVKRLINSSNPVGRRLDFMMQELNREANTIAAKTPDQAISQISVELKVLIEQMREQIQNIE